MKFFTIAAAVTAFHLAASAHSVTPASLELALVALTLALIERLLQRSRA